MRGRYKSAFADLIVWLLIYHLVARMTGTLTDAIGFVYHPGPFQFNSIQGKVFLVMVGFCVLCANGYLAISAVNGRSIGKALFGLRVVVADRPGKPGLARGLVRSAFQRGPYMGALMVVTGFHDAIAGTRVVPMNKVRSSMPFESLKFRTGALRWLRERGLW